MLNTPRLLGGNETLQLFDPVQDDVNLVGLAGINQQEPTSKREWQSPITYSARWGPTARTP